MSQVLIVENMTIRAGEILDAARRLGHDAVFITSDLSVYTKGRPVEETGLAKADEIVEVSSTTDVETLLRIARLRDARDKVVAIFSPVDEQLLAAASVASALGLPHTPTEALRTVRDKATSRSVLAAHGIVQPAFAVATTGDEVRQAVRRIGTPVVVKPVDGSASVNVGVAFDEDDAVRLADRIFETRSYGRSAVAARRALVEEYVPGALVSCETFSADGKHVVLGCTSRDLSPLPVQVELGGCFPASFDRLDEVVDLCIRSLDAVGLTFGAAHTEIIIGPQRPVIVEVNARLAGGMMPIVFGAAYHADMYEAIINLHVTGKIPHFGPPRGVAAIQSFVSDADGMIDEIQKSPLSQHADVVDYEIRRFVGDQVRRPVTNRDRMGSVITLAADEISARQLALEVVRSTRFVLRDVIEATR